MMYVQIMGSRTRQEPGGVYPQIGDQHGPPFAQRTDLPANGIVPLGVGL
jgi:hypothetical protein